jgi:hypothetical protein
MSTSTAILIGSGIIAVGLFIGLGRMKERPEPEPAPLSDTPVVAPTSRAVVAQQASEALAYQIGTLRSRCPPGSGEQHRYTLNVTFDPQGNEVMRGFVEDRQNPSSRITQCVIEVLTPLRVPAPGAVTSVEVPLVLP